MSCGLQAGGSGRRAPAGGCTPTPTNQPVLPPSTRTGKDRLVKYWDADKFEHLLSLEGHHGEVWCLAVGSLGDLVVSGGHDRSLRRWERTEEPFFVEEEKERRLESLFEADLEVGGW